MSNEELFQDLKQFIQAAVRQEAAGVRQELAASEKRLSSEIKQTKSEVKQLRVDMDERFDEVLDAIGEKFSSVDARHQDHERRITRLEHRSI